MQDKIKSYLQDIKNIVDIEIDKYLANENPLTEALFKSASYSTSGGKRVRAVFMNLIANNLFGVKREEIIIPSCAVELVHAASLIMDDLPYMDDSQLRRGKPANHVVFGQDVALLASIGILAQASQIILNSDKITTDKKIEIVGILNQSYGFEGLAAGQFVDLKLKDKNVDFEIIEFINKRKTAALFSAAGEIGAILGDASEKQRQAIKNFSTNIGFAFQIVDDILDIAGDERVVGKNLDHDKMNFVKLVGMDEAKKYLRKYQDEAKQDLSIFGNDAEELIGFSQFLIGRAW